jgi:hypothetical protein
LIKKSLQAQAEAQAHKALKLHRVDLAFQHCQLEIFPLMVDLVVVELLEALILDLRVLIS